MNLNTIDREAIMEALFNIVAASSSAYVTKERTVRLWTNVPQDQRPYLGLEEMDEDHVDGDYGPPSVRTLDCRFFIYCWTKDLPKPSSQLNELIGALEQAIKPPPLTGKLTLGGQVVIAQISGRLVKIPGYLDGQGIAVVPIRILVP